MWSYGHDYTTWRMNPMLWESLRALFEEIDYLQPALVADSPELGDVKCGAFSCTVAPEDAGVLTMGRRVGDKLYIIAVNTAAKPQKVTISAAERIAASRMQVLNESRHVEAKENAIRDEFRVWDVHIYTTEAEEPELVMKKILADPGYNRLPTNESDAGNLAWEGNGATARSSKKYANRKYAFLAIDGDVRSAWFPSSKTIWPPITQPEVNDWLEVTLSKEDTVGRVALQSWKPKYWPDPVAVLSDYRLEYEKEGKWAVLAEIKGNTEERVEHTFEPVRTRKLRLSVTRGTFVCEFEAYAR